MTFAWIKNELRVDFITFQGPIELLALADRIGGIGFALKKESWSAHVLRVSDRRAFDEAIELFIRQAVEPFVVRRAVFCAEFACEIGHRCAGDRCLESSRLRHGP